MKHTNLSMIIAASFFGAGAVVAGNADRVTLYDTTLDSASAMVPAGISRKHVDLDGDGYTDAVLTVREGMDMHAALDAIADGDAADVDAMTGSDRKDAAVRAGVATRGAAAVATTDRVGERVGPTWESRAIHAQGRSSTEAPGDTHLGTDDRRSVAVAAGNGRAEAGVDDGPQAIGVIQRMADVDGDGVADVFFTLRRDLDLHAALDAIADADSAQVRAMTGTDVKDAAYTAGAATRSAAGVASTDRVGERVGPAMESRTLHAQADATPEGNTEVEILATGAAAEALRDGLRETPERASVAEVERDTALEAREVAGTEQPVIINEQNPNDALAPTAGSGGFSDGYIARQAQDRFRELDRDGSGQLTRTEVPAGTLLLADYGEYDLDSDGEISRNEFQSWFAATGKLDDAPQTAGEDTQGEND